MTKLERNRSYYATNPDYRVKALARSAVWHKQHRAQANAIVKAHYLRKRNLLDDAKAVPCADCKIQYEPWVMQFDHRNPREKRFGIANISHHGVKDLLVEIGKCDVVCANCHADRTHKQIALTQRIECRRQ